MKKITFLLAVTLVMIITVSCRKENQYTINGLAKDYPDGTTVYLMTYDKPDWTTVDSATVTEGKFTMEGQVSPGFLGFLSTGTGDRTMIIVEPGEITIDMADGLPHGTETNEKLVKYINSMDGLEKQINSVRNEMEAALARGEANVEQYTRQLDALDAEEEQLLKTTIKENIENPIGVDFLCLYNSVFADDVDFLTESSNEIPKKYLNKDNVNKMLQNVNTILRTKDGAHFTDLNMTTREGENITLDQLVKSNKYVLVDFWASWCGPCCRSLPGISELNQKYGDKGLCILGISLDQSKEAWEAAISKYNMTWIQVSELKGWDSSHANLYGVHAIPATVLIDGTGRIIGRNLEASQIEEILEKEIGETAQ